MDQIEIRLLFESDIPAAMRLKEAAGWNQTEADWLRLLKLDPNGCFAAVEGAKLVGTTTTTTYQGDLAWVGMVLVDPQHRRRGIATRLMETALLYLKEKVAVIKLDATADGRPVYERFGFKTESLVERWRSNVKTQPVEQEEAALDREVLLVLDHSAFGADRSELIKLLIDDSGFAPGLVRNERGSLTGYALARAGTNAAYIGPVVTTETAQLEMLLDQILVQFNGTSVYIDFSNECPVSSSVLAERGFVKERNLIRMSLGLRSLKTSPLVIAIAGPEVG